MENTQSSTTIPNLNIILLQHQVTLYNIRELEGLEAKIIYFRTMLDSNLPSKHVLQSDNNQQDPNIDH